MAKSTPTPRFRAICESLEQAGFVQAENNESCPLGGYVTYAVPNHDETDSIAVCHNGDVLFPATHNSRYVVSPTILNALLPIPETCA